MSALRDYQREAHDALYAGWRAGTPRLGVSLPTGVGKTHIMAHLARTEVTQDATRQGDGAVLFLVHRDTLVEQTVAKLRATLPGTTSIGVVKGPRNEVGAQVIVASVHSLRRESRRRTLPAVRLGVADEAHVSVSPTYRAVYEHVGRTRWAGFSATWTRSDATGLGDCWDEIVYARSIRWAVRHGYLVPALGEQVGEGVDLAAARVSRTTGDYREDDLERLVMLEDLRDLVVRTALEREPERPTVLFAPTVTSAEYFRTAIEGAGLPTGGFYGTTSPGERRRLDAGLRDGSIRVVSTCTAVAEGYDNPPLSRCLLVRPTRHEGLFVQIVGRFLRPWPGKADALILDLVGATDDVSLRNAVDLSTTEQALHVDPDLDDDPLEEVEPASRERMVRRLRGVRQVELYAGTPVQWNVGPAGTPFVECGGSLVFMVEGAAGWYVGHTQAKVNGGRPLGSWVAEGLSHEDALQVASDYAEEQGGTLARRSASWRRQPIDAEGKQAAFARRLGIDVTDMTKGALADEISRVTTSRVLGYFATWAKTQRQYQEG